MVYPQYIDSVEKIALKDPLSDFLGVFDDGIVEFTYLDVVKNAGHSCPTVAGAYLMCTQGLKALYKDEMPLRGNIRVAFKEALESGVTGVVANVMTHITGATQISGFKGINGNFSRTNLMSFDENISADIKMSRVDTNESVSVRYNPSPIAIDPRQKKLMMQILQNSATEDEKVLFKKIWQERVEKIFQNVDKVITIEK